MRSPDAQSRDDVPQIAAALLDRLRARCAARPLHHQRRGAEFHRQCAAGRGCRAVDDAVGRGDRRLSLPRSSALLVNLGTFDRERREATEIAVETAARDKRALGARSGVRRPQRAARGLCARADRARAQSGAAQSRRIFRAGGQRAGARWRSRLTPATARLVVGLSGETDLVSDGERLATIANGHPLMAKVTAMGCAASALIAACLAVEPDAWRATARRAGHDRRRRRIGGGEGARPRQLRGRDHRCAPQSRWAGAHRTRKGHLMDVDLRLYALIDPAVAGGRTLGDLAARIAGSATLVQLRDKHGSTRAMVEEARALTRRAGAAGYSAADQRPRRRRARGGSRRRAHRPGRHVAGRCAAAARPHRDHRAQHQDRAAGARPRRSSISTMSAIGGVYGTTSKDNTSAPIGIDGLRAIVQAIRARDSEISDLRHRRHQCRAMPPT